MEISYFVAGLIGCMVGIGEIVGKHSAAPFSCLKNRYTLVYVGINAAASAFTLYLFRNTGLARLPAGIGADAEAIFEAVAAGVAAMLILRVGISLHFSGRPVVITLADLFQPLLRAASTEIDRAQASEQMKLVADLMQDLNLSRAYNELPSLCLSALRTVPVEAQKMLAETVKSASDECRRVNSDRTCLA